MIVIAIYHLERLDEENAGKWEEFNINSPEGSLYHSLKWKRIVEKSCDIRRQYFLLFKNGAVTGIFPLIEHNIHFFRGLLPESDPMTLHSIVEDYHDPSSMHFVISELGNNSKDRKKISYFCFSTLHAETRDNITTHRLYPHDENGDMVLDVTKSPPETIWDNFSAKKGQRKYIRRFEENGFGITEVQSMEDLKNFYKYYEENVNHIGGDLCPFSRIAEMWNSFSPDEMRITLLSKNSIVAGGVITLPYKPRRTLYLHFMALNRELPATYHPTYYLYWDAITWARDNHYEKVAFGAQHLDENNPRYKIKKEFGAQFKPIYSSIIPLTQLFNVGMMVNSR